MNILAVSDEVLKTHYSPAVVSRYSHVELLLGCGDLPYYYLDFLVSALEKPLFYVRGNHDCGRQYDSNRGELTGVRGGVNLHGQCINWKGILIAGLEGSVKYKPGAKCMFSQRQMHQHVIRLGIQMAWNRAKYGRAVDILITHAPPRGIHDQPDLPHHGFTAFLNFMRLYKPRYLLHGHIHRYHSHQPEITQYEDTQVINVYPSFELTYELEATA